MKNRLSATNTEAVCNYTGHFYALQEGDAITERKSKSKNSD